MLGEVCGWLWPKDCQTCGRAIGGQRPALCVDNQGAYAYASLHHSGCRHADWSESGGIGVGGGVNLSWTSRAWPGLPLVLGDGNEVEVDPRPFVLVNPGLEMVFLKPSRTAGSRSFPRRSARQACSGWAR